jgi:hypothetical protein
MSMMTDLMEVRILMALATILGGFSHQDELPKK